LRGGLAEVIRDALTRWLALRGFRDDGRVDLGTDTVERAIRPVTRGRKNRLFAGSDSGADRWATISTLITTANLNDVEPKAGIAGALPQLTDGHTINRIDERLPWNWRADPN